jgi:hypothetical protein
MPRKHYDDRQHYWCNVCGADMTDELTDYDPNTELECSECRVKREEARDD